MKDGAVMQIPKSIKIAETIPASFFIICVIQCMILFGSLSYSENHFYNKVHVFYLVLWCKKVS